MQMPSIAMLSVIYAECRNADCRYADCRYAECRFAECRGALKSNWKRLGQIYETRMSRTLGKIQDRKKQKRLRKGIDSTASAPYYWPPSTA